jgi:DNA topoisomerase-1
MATQPDALDAAREAGLRYVSDSAPGIRRRKRGKGFSYVGSDGRAINDETTLARIRKLAIPPAYTEVWICPSANGHIQATGRDARGRKQYRYHPKWREVRDETKFGRMLAFSEALPVIRQRVERDLGTPGLPREKVVAAVVHLLECTGIRVGNDEYARANRSFGLTTLQDDHVKVRGSTMRFHFRGKGGKHHSVSLNNKRLARVVRRCQALPGEDLFQYVDENGVQQTIGSSDVNDYLRETTGEDFTAKDFRTWAGTTLALEALEDLGPAVTEKEAKATILQAIDRVSEQLNNTRAICRKYYVHPLVFDHYMAAAAGNGNGAKARNGRKASTPGLTPKERAVVALLRNGR